MRSALLLLSLVLTIALLGIVHVYADPIFNIATSGDFSCSSNAKNNINAMKAKNPNLMIFLGDYSYVDSNIDCFIPLVDSIQNKVGVIGNHDDTESGSAHSKDQTMALFNIPSTGYFAKTIDVPGTNSTQDILVIGMYSQQSFAPGTAQFQFVKNAIETSKAPLKIVALHKPFVSCSCKHGTNGQYSNYAPLFKLGVDMVLEGHNHNTQYYNLKDGTMFIVAGAGGNDFYSLTSMPVGFTTLYKDASKFGFTYLSADFATMSLTGQFISNSGSPVAASKFVMKFNETNPNPNPNPTPTGNLTLAKVTEVTATASQPGSTNTPDKTIDNNLNTRWSADKDPQTITFQLNQTWTVSKVGIAFYKGNERTADFSINGQNFKSKGNTLQLQNFTLTSAIKNDNVAIVGHGNSISDWNSFAEVRIYGKTN